MCPARAARTDDALFVALPLPEKVAPGRELTVVVHSPGTIVDFELPSRMHVHPHLEVEGLLWYGARERLRDWSVGEAPDRRGSRAAAQACEHCALHAGQQAVQAKPRSQGIPSVLLDASDFSRQPRPRRAVFAAYRADSITRSGIDRPLARPLPLAPREACQSHQDRRPHPTPPWQRHHLPIQAPRREWPQANLL